VNFLDELLWAFAGLLLTIGGLFLPAAMINPANIPWDRLGHLPPPFWTSIPVHPLQVSYQIAAVLLVSCVGGQQAGTLSQIAYLILGLSGFQIFAQGGGLSYFAEPTFGYLLGFIPAAWLCGGIAFPSIQKLNSARPERTRPPVRLERLGFGSLVGLATIHLLGIGYLSLLALFQQLPESWPAAIREYSLLPLPGQLILICVVAVVARFLRVILFI
jgi:biotin transport system substrate-specific component